MLLSEQSIKKKDNVKGPKWERGLDQIGECKCRREKEKKEEQIEKKNTEITKHNNNIMNIQSYLTVSGGEKN